MIDYILYFVTLIVLGVSITWLKTNHYDRHKGFGTIQKKK